MSVLKLEHFERAVNDIAAHGDNDTLPFDIDTKFISDTGAELSKMAFEFATKIENTSRKMPSKYSIRFRCSMRGY